MNTDDQLRQKVQDELDWDPSFNGRKIGIAVQEGIVTLNGHVSSWAEKNAIEKAVKRVQGVKAYVENLEVNLPDQFERTDEEIAEIALKHLRWNVHVPEKGIILRVENGWINLEGEVQWNYQREAAKNALKNLVGIKGINNFLKIKNDIKKEDILKNIKSSFERNARIDANQIKIEVEGAKVILKGTVQSWAEKKHAEKIAYYAPGVLEVENKIHIEIPKLVY